MTESNTISTTRQIYIHDFICIIIIKDLQVWRNYKAFQGKKSYVESPTN